MKIKCPKCSFEFFDGIEKTIFEILDKNKNINISKLQKIANIPRTTLLYHLNKMKEDIKIIKTKSLGSKVMIELIKHG